MKDADPRPVSRFFRLSRWLVERASLLVPADRRDEWQGAWLGEIWHRALALESEGALRKTEGLDLLRRSFGAFSHALYLASLEWRPAGLGKDLLLGSRSLQSRPGFTVVALLTLALGIGANAFLYSVAESVLLHPFPYRDIDRLLAFESSFPKLSSGKEFVESMALQDFRAIEEESRTLASFAAFNLGNRDLGGIAEPQRLLTAAFWGDAFETLGMTPAIGRGFTREEMERGEPVAILSHRIFQQHFGADPTLVGRAILVNGVPRTLVGVMPPRLLLLDADLWLPMWYRRDEALPRSRRFLTVLARMKDGVALEDVRSEIDVLGRRLEEEAVAEAPEYEGFRISVSPFLTVWGDFVGPAAWILVAAAALALAIACGNIAGLLLARGRSRSQEIAIRTALGAPRARLVRHLFAEALLLALGGAVLGLAIAHVALEATAKRLPALLPLMGIEIELDAQAIAYTLGISFIAAIVFGLAPSIQTARAGAAGTLAPEGRSLGSRTAVRARKIFVAAQIAASLILVAGASLMLKSFDRLLAVDPGVNAQNVLTLRVTLPWERYQGKLVSFYDRWLDEVRQIPGVRASGLVSQFPPMVFVQSRLELERDPVGAEEEFFAAYETIASAGVFEALGMTLVRGRLFDDRDTEEAPPAIVVNQALAAKYFPDQDPIGRRLRTGEEPSEAPWATIVGVVSDARNRGVDREPAPELFRSYRQAPWINQMHLAMRTEGDPESAAPAVRERLRALDPDLSAYSVQTLEERFETVVFTRRFASIAMAVLAAMSLALAAMGLYGVIAFWVGERRRELGLRIALGADTGTLVRQVLWEASMPVAAGIALGLAGAFALVRFLSGCSSRSRPTIRHRWRRRCWSSPPRPSPPCSFPRGGRRAWTRSSLCAEGRDASGGRGAGPLAPPSMLVERKRDVDDLVARAETASMGSGAREEVDFIKARAASGSERGEGLHAHGYAFAQAAVDVQAHVRAGVDVQLARGIQPALVGRSLNRDLIERRVDVVERRHGIGIRVVVGIGDADNAGGGRTQDVRNGRVDRGNAVRHVRAEVLPGIAHNAKAVGHGIEVHAEGSSREGNVETRLERGGGVRQVEGVDASRVAEAVELARRRTEVDSDELHIGSEPGHKPDLAGEARFRLAETNQSLVRGQADHVEESENFGLAASPFTANAFLDGRFEGGGTEEHGEGDGARMEWDAHWSSPF